MVYGNTVAAVSTPYGKGGIAVIRITGDRAVETASRCFRPFGPFQLSDAPSGKTVYGEVIEDGNVIDDGIAVVFRAPRSYTGEDTVEISCHGGILVTRNVLAAVLSAGADPAGPGEFTRRAFVSGKLSLTEAEAIADIIDARTDSMLRLSRQNASGRLSGRIEEIYQGIVQLIASVYALIDYPEEDLSDIPAGKIREEIERFHGEITGLLTTYRAGRAIVSGVETTICGRTNVGKSSVYNRLVGTDRAIVSDVEGTTRDLLYETVEFGNVTLNLCDTAGIRESDDTVEKIGIERAAERALSSELLLAVFDGSDDLTDDDELVIGKLAGIPQERKIALINKCDIKPGACREKIKKAFMHAVEISARTGEGFDRLRSVIGEIYLEGGINVDETPIIYNARQYAAVKKASESIKNAMDALESGFSPDVVSVDLELALEALGECDGRSVSEDVVESIFSRFCVGK